MARSSLRARKLRCFSLTQSEAAAMNYDDQNNQNLDIDPTIILLGMGYAAMLCMAISWTASLVI